MLIKLQANQIPKYWTVIKHASTKADNVKEDHLYEYCKELLLNLLNGVYECILSVDEDKKIRRLLIGTIIFDEVTKEKVYMFKCLYGYVGSDETLWKDESENVYQYVKGLNCKKIRFTTSNRRIIELANAYGFKEESNNYVINL